MDFPILPVNQVAVIKGNAGKPIYQMSKWWARRRFSVFRTIRNLTRLCNRYDLPRLSRNHKRGTPL
jgi:hypothetical protein